MFLILGRNVRHPVANVLIVRRTRAVDTDTNVLIVRRTLTVDTDTNVHIVPISAAYSYCAYAPCA